MRLPSGELREFYLRSAAVDEAWPTWADDITDRYPDVSAAWCRRGWQRVTWAWQQGAAAGDEAGAAEALVSGLGQAEDELSRAATLDPSDPTPWSCLVTSGRGLGLAPDELWRRYHEATSRAPDLLAVHRQLLQALCKKSGGSHDEMFAFAHQVSDESPPGSPRHSLLVDAHLECWLDLGVPPAEYFPGGAEAQILEAANRSIYQPGFADTPQFPYAAAARNSFAVGLALCGRQREAWEQAHLINGRLADWPWSYLGDPAERFASLYAAGPG